ncbi:lysM and putative peptidoglycan-binding domain-containing protein 4 [Salarias fasciatus]|uniref:LysM and putative peptidoglycan-binding domain-containing protein 4 n=1 Tax=Salarias fasciatus TaxID=181472 RepID=A0A672FYY6_SALFA|nr:lysM and putative peptidoglycan-binding domain-containing protein 4 [Salarias fasciatus]
MWRGENGPRAFQAPVDVHASADGQVYMFKRKPNDATSSDDEELLEMRPQTFQDQKQGGLRNVELLERELLEGDSLNKLALQYGCKVADIKRVNNLMQEQDLFALKSIKIPVQKHSLLTETQSDPCDPQDEMPRSSPTPAKPQDRSRARPHLQEATAFLMEVDNDLDKLIQNTADQDEGFLEISEKPRLFGFRKQRPTSHGADWGIQWWNAVIAMVLIGIVLPLFYVIYFKAIDSNNVASVTDGSHLSNSSTNSSGALQSGHSTSPLQTHEPG